MGPLPFCVILYSLHCLKSVSVSSYSMLLQYEHSSFSKHSFRLASVQHRPRFSLYRVEAVRKQAGNEEMKEEMDGKSKRYTVQLKEGRTSRAHWQLR